MRRINRITCLLIIISMMCGLHNIKIYAADHETRINRNICVNGTENTIIKTLDLNYEDAVCVSLKGMASALAGTEKSFYVNVTSDEINITLNADYNETANQWTSDELNEIAKVNLGKNDIKVNEIDKSYYSVIMRDGDDGYDAYLTLVDIAMILDINMSIENDVIFINTNDSPFFIDTAIMEESGYLQGVNALLIGDATTGRIFYKYDADDIYPIASTTKLMTYYVFMDAVRDGKASYDDMVYITQKAEDLSKSIDGVIPMTEGMSVPVEELVKGMLLASSNECAYSIAVYVAGNEETFVKLMNDKADEIGLKDAIFYNPHGLPDYSNHVLPAKKQNRMTAEDMFTLCQALLQDYPEIKETTEIKKTTLKTLGKEIKNTNGVLYNIPEVRGFKTGTTNKSGACLITQADVMKDDMNHDLIVVLFGAEGNVERTRVSEIAVRYGMTQIKLNGEMPIEEEDNSIPEDPEKVVERLVNIAFK